MRFKKWPQLPGAGRTTAGHHHGSHKPTSSEAILLGKMAHHTKQICRECTIKNLRWHSIKQYCYKNLGTLQFTSYSVDETDNFDKNVVATLLNNIWSRWLWLTTHSSPCDGCNHKKCSWREKMRRSLGSCSFHTPPSYMRCPTITVSVD